MRILAIDLGDKRTGLATGDDGLGFVHPAEVLEADRGPLLDEALDRAIEAHGPELIVVGLPLNMDDSEGPRAKLTREFGDALAARHGIPVVYQDERLTSHEADEKMARSGRTHKQKKKIRDALAAAAILQDYLDEHPRD